MSFFVYDSTKHAWVYITYIYIKMLLILTCSQMLYFFWVVCICTTDESWWLSSNCFPQSAVPASDVQLHWYYMVKQDPWLGIMFFSSWIHGNKQKHLNNTQISGMIYLFHLLNRICCRNDSKSVHISVVRSVCTIMCLWPSLCMFWLYGLVNKIQIIKKKKFSISSHSLLSRSHTVRFLIVFCDCCLSHCTNMIPMSNCRISVVLMSDCTTVKTRQKRTYSRKTCPEFYVINPWPAFSRYNGS